MGGSDSQCLLVETIGYGPVNKCVNVHLSIGNRSHMHTSLSFKRSLNTSHVFAFKSHTA
eukprot:SAG31_NODE_26437_length_442_cov_1.023324_1_plen_58_part_10